MTVLVGVSPQARDDAAGAVTLAARLAAAWDEDVAVTMVVPGDDDGGGDDPVADARRVAEAVLASAGRAATWRTVPARSPADALLDEATTAGVSAIVLGTDADRSGRIAARVARASPVPVGLARPGSGAAVPFTRVTCAYAGTPDADAVLRSAASIARRCGAALRVASFAIHRPPGYPPEAGLDAEDDVVAGWAEQAAAAQRAALARLDGGTPDAETGVWAGESWEDAVRAVDWHGGDLLVLGGSPGPATRLFLGDRVRAILHAAPVPALIV